MKRMKIAAIALILVLGSFAPNFASAQYYDGYDDRDQDVTYQDFYDELSPYGRWVEYPGQGYVWVPDAGNDFQPYSTQGHWVWTDNYEWMWVSDYDWGWAPFHYGRWDYDNYYGWYWVPGYEWSPAWVAWRDGGDYYGWAPIRPGISISINFNIGGYSPPYNFWCFAPRRYITSPRIYDYYIDRRQNITIINQTNIIVNNYNYGGSYGFRSGPRRYDAEVYCGRINPVRFRQSYIPGRSSFRNNEVSLYRPTIQRDNNRSFAPRQVERYDRNNGSIRQNRDVSGGTFRNNSANTRRPDDRDRVDNNRFDRRNDNPARTRDVNRENNGGFRREDSRQPNTNPNMPNDRSRRMDRTDNGNPNRQPADRRFENPRSNPNRQIDPGAGQPNRDPAVRPDNRNFERRNDNPGRSREMRTEQPQRQPQMERRQEAPQRQPNFERRQEQPQRQPQMERRQEQPQRQPQMERRQEQPQRQPQMDRPQQQPQQQPQQRSFERRGGDNGGGNGGNGNGGGNGRGRGGRF